MINPTEQCVICGNKEVTKEDIIPKWLQNHFDLWNQRIGLSNNTNLFYKQAIIQLCNSCNNERLSRLETRIKNETATHTDYYLWALKIRFLLSVKDTTLQFDRKDKSKGKLLSQEQGFIGYELIRFALQNFEDSDFCFIPNPFGSVFVFDNPIKDKDFSLIDVPHPYWGLSVALPNSKILAVLFADRGMVKREFNRKYGSKKGIENWFKKLPVKTTKELTQVLMLKLLITQYQIENIPFKYDIVKKKILSGLIPKKTKPRMNIKKEICITISNNVGLGPEYGNDIYNLFNSTVGHFKIL